MRGLLVTEPLKASFKAWLEDLASYSRRDMACRATLLYLLFSPIGKHSEPLFAATTSLAAVGLLSARVSRSGGFWLVLACLSAADLGWWADNHWYLRTYWCLALALCVQVAHSGELLAHNARLLLCATFVFATVWKGLLSEDFLSGEFFQSTLILDARFKYLAVTLGGMSPDEWVVNNARVSDLRSGAFGLTNVFLAIPERLRALSRVLTWLTLGMEALVAVLFSLPQRLVGRASHYALVVFIAGTYAIAPVPGFGWMLCLLGLAAVSEEDRNLTFLYFVGAAVVMLHRTVSWFELIAEAIGL